MGVWSRDDVVTIGRREIAGSFPRVSGASWFMIWWLVQSLRVPITFESQKCYQDFLDIHNPRAVLENSLRWDNVGGGVEWRRIASLNDIVSILTIYNSSQVTFKVQLTCPLYFCICGIPHSAFRVSGILQRWQWAIALCGAQMETTGVMNLKAVVWCDLLLFGDPLVVTQCMPFLTQSTWLQDLVWTWHVAPRSAQSQRWLKGALEFRGDHQKSCSVD